MKNENQNEQLETITELRAKITELEFRATSSIDWLKRAYAWSNDGRARSAIGVVIDLLAADTEGDGTRPDPRSRALHDAWLVSKATVAMRAIVCGGDAVAIAKKFLLLLDNDSEGV